MKRIITGLTILLLLLMVSAVCTLWMGHIHSPTAQLLRQASAAAQAEDWKKADTLAQRANNRWQASRRLTATVADHSPMDEIDGLFAELEVYRQQREMPHFAATCQHLAMLTEAMGENHALNLWNML